MLTSQSEHEGQYPVGKKKKSHSESSKAKPKADRATRDLSRRERQIMDVIYEQGASTSAEVLDAIPDPPSYSAVRAMLRILEEKGHLQHRQDGPRYVYMPVISRDKASKSALQHLVQTFFDGSTQGAVAALLDMDSINLDADELNRLEAMIQRAREEGE